MGNLTHQTRDLQPPPKAPTGAGGAAAKTPSAPKSSTQRNSTPRPTSTAPNAATIRAACRCDNPRCDCHRDGGNVHCPAHIDNSPSLSITEGSGGKPLVKCFAGCSQDEVIAALKSRGAWPSSNRASVTLGTPRPAAPAQTVAQPSDGNSAASGLESRPQVGLQDRGLSRETLKHFQIRAVNSQNSQGWKYPTFHADGSEGRTRFKSAQGKPKYQWWKGGDNCEPDGYNLQAVPDGASGVWIVGGEPDVWVATQAGLLAVSTFGETQGHVELAQALAAKGVHLAHIGVTVENGINCTLRRWKWPERSVCAFFHLEILLPEVISSEVDVLPGER